MYRDYREDFRGNIVCNNEPSSGYAMLAWAIADIWRVYSMSNVER